MVKYCGRCGVQNSDDAKFCYSCGNPFSQPQAQQSDPSAHAGGVYFGSQAGATPNQPQRRGSRAERALQLLASNLGLILPILLLLFAQLVIGLIVGAIFFVVAPYRALVGRAVIFTPILGAGPLLGFLDLVFWVLTGVFLSMVVVESRSVALSQSYTLGQAWGEVRSKINQVVLMGVILGVVNTILGLIPLVGWLLAALFFSYFVVVESLVFTRGVGLESAMSGALSLVRSMVDRDALTALALLVAAILSEIPLINLFAIPYASLLAVVYALDVASSVST